MWEHTQIKMVVVIIRIEMAGKTFNKLYVIEKAGVYNKQDTTWRCLCSCGKETVVRGNYLRSGHTKSCGNCINYSLENDYMKCTVSSGRSFIFDTEDYDLIKNYRWSVDKYGYVLARDKNQCSIKLHRLILNPKPDEVIDHINGLPWDCRKENLRITTQNKNTYNQKIKKSNTSGYKGVCFDKRRNKYIAYIHPNKKFKYLGCYLNPKEAALAYNKAASFYFGEYARLNDIGGT